MRIRIRDRKIRIRDPLKTIPNPQHCQSSILDSTLAAELSWSYGVFLKVREIFDRSDFPDFYTIKSLWVGDLVVKILTYYFYF